MLAAVDLVLRLLELAILARVVYSWIDQDPYATNGLKRLLWSVTDPILEPIRRLMPAVGMFDLSPIVALVLLQTVQVLLASILGG